MKKEKPHPLDITIGSHLLLRRKMMGMSQDVLAKRVGITFQQIQKYERGVNSINARRLFEFALFFDWLIINWISGCCEGGICIPEWLYPQCINNQQGDPL